MHNRLWTWVTGATLLLLLAAGGWAIRADRVQDAQLLASCERGNDVLRLYAQADNAIALQLDVAIAEAAGLPRVVVLAAERAAVQRRALARSIEPIDCGRTVR